MDLNYCLLEDIVAIFQLSIMAPHFIKYSADLEEAIRYPWFN